ncbi:MAG: hypothetical protein NXY57DRAFT_960840 [Lentinula lateritia]|nr:MAG: hypothetical protein NXY57DRAFT_960840 [Lentinula lateritia]
MLNHHQHVYGFQYQSKLKNREPLKRNAGGLGGLWRPAGINEEAAAASYLRNRKTILRKAQDKRISEFVEKIGHPDADLWYPYRRNTYHVGTEAGVSTNPRIYL